MKNIFKSTVSVFVILSFLTMAAMCCCVIKAAQGSFQKASCSHCKSESKPTAAGHECCLTKVSPMEVMKNLSGPISLFPLVVFLTLSFLYVFPNPRFISRIPYLNGPPRCNTVVPLYILSRSIRI